MGRHLVKKITTYYWEELYREREAKSSLNICQVFKIIKSWGGVKFNVTYNARPTLARINSKFLNTVNSCEFLIKRAFERVMVAGSSKMLTSEVGTVVHLRPVRANKFRAWHTGIEGRWNVFSECAVFFLHVSWALHSVKISILCALHHSLMPSHWMLSRYYIWNFSTNSFCFLS